MTRSKSNWKCIDTLVLSPTFNRFTIQQIDGKSKVIVVCVALGLSEPSVGFAATSLARHETVGRGATGGVYQMLMWWPAEGSGPSDVSVWF